MADIDPTIEDTEGHSRKSHAIEEDDTQGHSRKSHAIEEDDVEGHKVKG